MMLSKVVQPIWVCIREGMNENPLVIFFSYDYYLNVPP